MANNGTMLTVRAVSLTLCYIMAMLVARVGCPSTSAKILADLCFVCMNGPPTIPVWDVHTISHAADVIEPSSTPLLTCFSFRTVCLWHAPILVCGRRRHDALYFYVCCGGRANCTRRLTHRVPVDPTLACARAGTGC